MQFQADTEGVESFSSFLSGLPDADLRSLYERFGSLLSEEAREVLPELADAVLGDHAVSWKAIRAFQRTSVERRSRSWPVRFHGLFKSRKRIGLK